jgi:hypothetical protein
MVSSQWQQSFNYIVKQYKEIEQITANAKTHPDQIVFLIRQALEVATKLHDSSVNTPKDINLLTNKWHYFNQEQIQAFGNRIHHVARMLQDLLQQLEKTHQTTELNSNLNQIINKLFDESNRWIELMKQVHN